MCNYNVDLLALSEVNKDWRKVVTNNTIWNSTMGWREHRRVQVSHNTSQPVDKEFVVGGTLMCRFDDLAYRITSQVRTNAN